MEIKTININKENIFYTQYQGISIDKNNAKKPYEVFGGIVKKRGKDKAITINVSTKQMAEILKSEPGLFFSLPKEVFADYFLQKQEITKEKCNLEIFLDAVKEGILKVVNGTDCALTNLEKDIDEFQEKILEKVDFEKENYKERIEAVKKVKAIKLDR